MEIFTVGILFSGGLTFLWNALAKRSRKDLFLGLVFLASFSYIAAVLSSQLMNNLGRPLADLIVAQKIVAISILLGGLFVWLFLVERFKVRFGHWLSLLIGLGVAALIARVLSSSVNLVFREGIIEPIVYFSHWVPVKPFFALMWALLAIFYFGSALASAGGRRALALYAGGSVMLVLAALFSSFLYIRFGEAGYLLASWILLLISSLGLLLSELVSPDAPEAFSPLRFLRTRILFKLVLIFILLIVILFEATTLATINISKTALSKYIKATYLKVAQNIAGQIAASPEAPTPEKLQVLISQVELAASGVIFVVNNRGELVAHPDRKRALQRENLRANEGVNRLLEGQSGAGEFRDELNATVVGAYVPIPKYGLGVVVEEPRPLAYFDMRLLESNSLLFVIAGMILTALTGIFFARSIERPIKALTLGTEAVSRGELGYHISVNSVDEIGRLATAFNQMTRDLRDSQERLILSEKLASLGTMAAGMAHEIKNPLVSLRTFTQLLQQKWDDKEFRDKFSQIIPTEIERINRIAESLLKFGRPMKPELTRVDVNALLEEVLLLFESECKKYNVSVTKKMAELPEISGDAGQLSQAFVNIIKNAIESMQAKGGELIVKSDVGEVVKLGKIRSRKGTKLGEEMVWGEEEEMVKPLPVIFIEVTDTGEGINEENLKSLFDPFFTTKMTGTGMGLPITLRIIEEHKGSVKVKSRPGQGTTFIITLPQKL